MKNKSRNRGKCHEILLLAFYHLVSGRWSNANPKLKKILFFFSYLFIYLFFERKCWIEIFFDLQNPFLPKKGGGKTANTAADSIELSPSPERGEEISPQGKKIIRNVKTEQFQRTGRSNSAPDSYDWQTNGR